ncbi:CotG/ExsB N-terminal domain-containing protein [Priestia flexa]
MVKAKNGFYKEVFRLYIQSKRIRKAAESLQKSDLGKFMYQEPKGHCSKRSSKKTAHSHKKMEEKTAHSHKKTEKKTEKKTNKRTENKYCTKRSRTYRKVTCFCKEKHSHTSKRSCKNILTPQSTLIKSTVLLKHLNVLTKKRTILQKNQVIRKKLVIYTYLT